MINFWTKLPKPFTVLAPMERVTDMAFREMVSTHLIKPDVIFTEFVSADGIIFNPKKLIAEKLKYSEKQRPIVAQIWGTNLINLEKVAKVIEDLGFDGIDVNMGCPVKNVLKLGGGAALIKNTALAIKIVQSVKKGASKIPVSVKTRLGCDFEALLNTNLQALTIHGRTTKQMSNGMANWDEIGKVVKLRNQISPSTIIIGNGDINSYSEVLKAHEVYGVDGVMIGRGIFRNPFVFDRESHSLTKDERVKFVEKHIKLIEKHGGLINKFLRVYLSGFSGAKELRIKYLN